MRKLTGALAGAILAPTSLILGAILFACATDNGDNVHGDQFGPTPTRPDGATGSEGGSTTEGGTPDPDAATDGDAPGPTTCTDGTVAVLAGRATPAPSLSAAVQVKGGAWSGSALAGGASESLPSLVAFGSGFLGVTHGAGDVIQSVTYTTSWSAPAPIGVAGVKNSPSLALVGTKAHVVYTAGPGGATNFFHGVHSGTAWDSADDPVGSPQSFGNSAAGLAAAGSDLAFVQVGSDSGVYFRTWNNTWGALYTGPDATPGVDGAGGYEFSAPALASVDGTFDTVLVYAEKDTHKVQWAARNATSKVFTAPAFVNTSPTTYAATSDALSLVRVGQFTLLMTFRGEDGKGYYVSGAIGASSITWSSPAALAAGGVAVDTTPRAAKGVCGDDAIIAFASSGQVKVVRLRGSTLTAPEAVTGAAGSRVAIATR